MIFFHNQFCLICRPWAQKCFRLAGHGNHVTSASFSATGGRVLTSSGDGTAKIWDAHNGRELVCLEGHTDWIFSASFNQTEDRIGQLEQYSPAGTNELY